MGGQTETLILAEGWEKHVFTIYKENKLSSSIMISINATTINISILRRYIISTALNTPFQNGLIVGGAMLHFPGCYAIPWMEWVGVINFPFSSPVLVLLAIQKNRTHREDVMIMVSYPRWRTHLSKVDTRTYICLSFHFCEGRVFTLRETISSTNLCILSSFLC